MIYCVKCGEKAEDGMKFCPQCGAPLPGGQSGGKTEPGAGAGNAGGTSQTASGRTGDFAPQDVNANKAMGVLSYLGILVLIPLLAGDKNSEYVRFHTNQGLALFLASVAVDILDGRWFWDFHDWFDLDVLGFSWALDILSLILFVFMIMGIVYACRGERRELPVIGQIHLLK